jgi:catechol 2,3-dioxygenase-like lactoylglutathione lyase family enzyme
MLDHVSAKVSDVPAAKGFYEQVLAPLGVKLMMDGSEEGWAGFGTGSGIPQFWITNTEGRGPAHFAFSAPDRATVDAFYATAIAAGATDNGPPGLRTDYHENYYGAYVHDADGNNIEAVCHKPE